MDFEVLGIKITQFEWGNDLVIKLCHVDVHATV